MGQGGGCSNPPLFTGQSSAAAVWFLLDIKQEWPKESSFDKVTNCGGSGRSK